MGARKPSHPTGLGNGTQRARNDDAADGLSGSLGLIDEASSRKVSDSAMLEGMEAEEKLKCQQPDEDGKPCGRPVIAKGRCPTHYQQLRRLVKYGQGREKPIRKRDRGNLTQVNTRILSKAADVLAWHQIERPDKVMGGGAFYTYVRDILETFAMKVKRGEIDYTWFEKVPQEWLETDDS